MSIDVKQLKAAAHKLKPIVILGDKGLTENVHVEIERGLHDHELIKIKDNYSERDERKQLAEKIANEHEATLVQIIGHMIVIYKKRPKHPA